MNEPELIHQIFTETQTIAVVGLSSRRYRPSFAVSECMQAAGFRIIPVNPIEKEVLGERAYPRLEEIPITIDLVNVFRRSEFVPEIVESSIRTQVRWVWMQEGVVHEPAAARAASAGLGVVMDRCIWKEYQRWKRFRGLR